MTGFANALTAQEVVEAPVDEVKEMQEVEEVVAAQEVVEEVEQNQEVEEVVAAQELVEKPVEEVEKVVAVQEVAEAPVEDVDEFCSTMLRMLCWRMCPRNAMLEF